MTISYLSFEEIVHLHDLLCFFYGGDPAIHDAALIESALGQPSMAAFGVEPFPTVWLKAAAYCYYLCLNHGFKDGNKRIAVAAAFHFLKKNGIRPRCSSDALYDAVIHITAKQCTVEELAAVLQNDNAASAQ
jgi:death-on-curing protein